MTHDLEEDIRNSPEIMAKIRAEDKRYAQNLYAAWCNMRWKKHTPWTSNGGELGPIDIDNDDLWSATWRGAGGIVAHLRNKGEDYMDYYCSGIRNVEYDDKENEWWDKRGYAAEGEVKDEIAKDLAAIGWFPVPYDDKDLV